MKFKAKKYIFLEQSQTFAILLMIYYKFNTRVVKSLKFGKYFLILLFYFALYIGCLYVFVKSQGSYQITFYDNSTA